MILSSLASHILFAATPFDPGTITNATQSVAFNTTPAQLQATAANGGSGIRSCKVYIYAWQSSANGIDFTNIPNANQQNYQPGPLTSTTWFRRLAQCIFGTSGYTNIAVVTVTGVVYGVAAPDNTTGDANAGMNWVITKQFDDNGNVIGESKAFFDTDGQPLQTQSKIKYRSDPNTLYTHVFATQSIPDLYGRNALVTMPAPINNSEFSYKGDFVVSGQGGSYNYANFDRYDPQIPQTDKTGSPDPVGGQTEKGTLGWYYGNQNIWEPYTATTNYPYSRQTFYNDGTGDGKKSAGAGESFRMGAGHEAGNYITPVNGELAHYIQVRNKFFNATAIGTMPGDVQGKAIQLVGRDANGKEAVIIADKEGRQLVKGRPGNDLAISNQVTLSYNGKYMGNIPGVTRITIDPEAMVEAYAGTTLLYSGPYKNIGGQSYLSHRITGYQLMSNIPFTYTTCSFFCVTPAVGSNLQFYYFKILADNTPVTLTGDYILYDMDQEAVITLPGNGMLNKGYYKVVANTGIVSLTFGNGLSALTYNYYNQLGQLIATIPPEGVKKLLGSGINNYATKENIPFITLYQYDNLGRMVKAITGDEGASEMVYRADGKMRFSQNAEQKLSGRYSYVNYDPAGRPAEGGEYQPDGSGIAFTSDMSLSSDMKNILENTGPGGGLTTGIKKNVIMTLYDEADGSHGQAGYVQDPFFLRGLVSRTKKYSSITNNVPNDANLVSATWYGYDEEGRVTWKIQGLPAISGGLLYKTMDFTYDVMGRTVKRVFQNGNPSEIFVHYYEYDASTKRLSKVYTNTEDNDATKKLQANYIYYLQGPLKRVELAGNLQGIDYTYTVQGGLKAINNGDKTQDPGGDGAGNGFGVDAYGMVLDYFTGDYMNGRPGIATINGVDAGAIAADSYTGNIKAMTWYSKKPAAAGLPEDALTYVYNYDDKYRYTQSTWGTGVNFANKPATFTPTAFNRETVKDPSTSLPAYDDNGNILSLQRTDGTGAQTDNFAYNYFPNTNKLQNVTNGAGGANYASYGYDAAGQITAENTGDPSQQKYIQYDGSGKVLAVARDAAFTQKVVEYAYDEVGRRVMKKSYNSSFQPAQVTWYYGDVVFTQAVSGGTAYGALVPQEYQVEGGGGRLGIYYRQSNVYAYEMTDHLGNVRAVVAQSGSGYDVRMYSDYYPYGRVIQQYQGPDGYRYGYQGQYAEKDGETDWNAFELRMYDSRIGRWLSGDPKGQFSSPYMAMGNNPVNGTDPDGGWWEEWNNERNGRGWISNAGYDHMQGLIASGYDPSYHWVGNHFTGHGVISYNDLYFYGTMDGSPDYGTLVTYKHIVDPVTEDLFQTIQGVRVAVYLEEEVKVTLGARVGVELGPLDFDANIISINLWSHSSESGNKGVISHFKDWEKYEVAHEVSLGYDDIAKVSISAEYKLGEAGDEDELKASVDLLNMNASVVYNDATEEILKNFNIKAAADTKLKGALLLGVEYSNALKISIVPRGDIEAWLKKQE